MFKLTACLWVQVFGESHELLLPRRSGQPEFFGSLAYPVPANRLSLGVVIPDAQVFLKIFLGIGKTVLRFCRKH